MARAGILVFFVFLITAATGCTALASPGNASLPPGIEGAQIPDTNISGYLYFSSTSPLSLAIEYFVPENGMRLAAEANPEAVQIDEATIVVGETLDDFAGVLKFSSDEHARIAWDYFEEKTMREDLWGELESPDLALARGATPWIDSFRQSYASDGFVPLIAHDSLSWSLVTNLPVNPPADPVAAGVMKIDTNLLESLANNAGIALDGIGNAFGFVRVDTVGFGIYSDHPVDVAPRIDERYLIDSGASILFVSQSTYPSGLVAFMLSVIASRTSMELITLGDTNARYRTIQDLHLIIKNRGSLVFAAVAGSRAEAEELLLSALTD